MKIRCAYCKELFIPSPSQRRDLANRARRFCNLDCKAADQARQTEAREAEARKQAPLPPDLGYHVHVKVADRGALRRLVKALEPLELRACSGSISTLGFGPAAHAARTQARLAADDPGIDSRCRGRAGASPCCGRRGRRAAGGIRVGRRQLARRLRLRRVQCFA